MIYVYIWILAEPNLQLQLKKTTINPHINSICEYLIRCYVGGKVCFIAIVIAFFL